MEVIPGDQASPTIETGVRLQENQHGDWLRPGVALPHHNHHCTGSSWSPITDTTREEITIISILQMENLRPRDEKPHA